MKFRGNSNVLAVALAGLAVVLAAGGTAYAVTATTVKIADAKTPSHIARVDSAGRLLTTTPPTTSTITSGGLLYNYQNADNFITSPTTATLAITKLDLSESNANSVSNATELRVVLYKVGVNSSGQCASTGYAELAFYQLSAGDDIVDPFPAPLIVKPTGKAKYCLDLFVYQINSSTALGYLPSYQFDGFVASGSYSGIGVSAAAAKAATKPGRTGDRR